MLNSAFYLILGLFWTKRNKPGISNSGRGGPTGGGIGSHDLSNHFTNTFLPFTIFASAPPGHRSNKLLHSLAAQGRNLVSIHPMRFADFALKLGGNLDGSYYMLLYTWNLPSCWLMWDFGWGTMKNLHTCLGHIRILPKHVEHMLINKILKLHMIMWRRAGSIEYDPEWLWQSWLPKNPTTISIPLFRKRRVFSSQVQAQAPHFLLGDCGLTVPRQRGHCWGGMAHLVGKITEEEWTSRQVTTINEDFGEFVFRWNLDENSKGRFRSHWSRFNVSTSWKFWHSKKIPLSTTSFPISNLYQQSTFQGHASAMR